MERAWLAIAILAVVFSLVLGATGLASDELGGLTVLTFAGPGVDTSSKELTNLRAILTQAGAIYTTTDKEEPAELDAALADADVFIIPEMSDADWISDITALGADWTDVLEDFLARGGLVVGTAPYGGIGVLRGAGLTTATGVSGWGYTGNLTVDVSLAPTSPLSVAETFGAPNATFTLATVDEDAEIWASASTGGPVVVRLDRKGGVVVLMSFDFYQSGTAFDAMLINTCLVGTCPTCVCPASLSQSGSLEPGQKESLGCTRVSGLVDSIGFSLAGKVEIGVWTSSSALADGDSPFLTFSATDNGAVLISSPLLRTGQWHFAATNMLAEDQAYTLAVMPFPTLDDLAPLLGASMGMVQDLPINPFNTQLSTATGRVDIVQYYVQVRSEGSLRIRLTADGPGKVFVRYGEPIDVNSGAVIADLFAPTVGNEAALSVAGAFLQAGTYYIAVEQAAIPSSYEISAELAP